jgi:hypothetical protein
MSDTANACIRRVIETLQAEGIRSVSAAMSQPALHKWVDTLRVLGRMGGRPPRGVIGEVRRAPAGRRLRVHGWNRDRDRGAW